MLCSISGEAPQHAVASSKSGHVYEKRLIEAYITENHKDPVNGEDLEIEDLVELKSARVAIPRPPTLTSIPSLLATFQNEWDSLALETFTLRQNLQQTRQELSTALYQHDAAVRVIARLTKERDQARNALSKIRVEPGNATNDDAMQIDSQGLPDELAAKVDATQEKLSKSRRKRPVPENWAGSEDIGKFKTTSSSEPLFVGSNFLATNESGEGAIVSSAEGVASIYSVSENKIQESYTAGGIITDALWRGSQPIVSTSLGDVKVLGSSNQISFSSHAGCVNSIALHPCGDILASVGEDKSFVFYDLNSGKAVNQIYTNCELTAAAFHPDGHIFAAAGIDGQIKVFHVKTGENAANFELGGPVQDISFSENGIWFSAVAKESNSISIFDLRKEGKAAEVKVLEAGGEVFKARWDYTGQYLAVCGPRGVTIFQYTKSTKSWSDVISIAEPATSVSWGPEAKSLFTTNIDGIIKLIK
ncbi:hypothetical protein K3495_g9344 [Podosphaera aphanis]|nr:hypothetical protein K3495_g9344 [Podosphaera aphanis]